MRSASERVLGRQLRQARGILTRLPAPPSAPPLELSDDFEAIRWFPLPSDSSAPVRRPVATA
jgi:hypothetical protein